MFQQLKVLGSNAYLRAGTAVALVAPALVHATPTDPFDTAIDTVTTKIEGYGAALVGVAAVAVVFGIAIAYVKKIRGASK